MSGIRPLERTDLPSVCELYELVARSGSRKPPEQLLEYFERTFMDHPWAGCEVPSLVYEDADGRIVGFLGSHVRRLRVDGRPLLLGCSGQLVADPAPRHVGVGALLMRRYLAGPQDVSITDGATDTVRRMWVGLGGQPLVHASIGWTRVFRPGAAAGTVLARRSGRAGLRRAAALVAPAIDALAGLLPRQRTGFVPARPAASAEVLTAQALVDLTADAARWLRLYPDYDLPYVDWLFRELAAVDVRGRLVRALVRDPAGKVAGWYIYYLARGDVSQVLHIAAPSGDTGLVLDHLLADAARGGSAAVQGRVEPALLGVLWGRRCVLSRTEWALVHSQDPSVLALLGSTKALLSRLEGEWWMGHHVLWRDGPSA